jgi:hypothetical protein
MQMFSWSVGWQDALAHLICRKTATNGLYHTTACQHLEFASTMLRTHRIHGWPAKSGPTPNLWFTASAATNLILYYTALGDIHGGLEDILMLMSVHVNLHHSSTCRQSLHDTAFW